MRRITIFLLALCSFLTQAEIVISDGSIRLLPPGTPNTSAYFQIENKGSKDVFLVGASSEISDTLELHNHIMKGEVMKMVQQEQVRIPAGESVSFEPGGLHVMVFGLKAPLSEKQKVTINLLTQDGASHSFEATAKMPGAHAHHGHH